MQNLSQKTRKESALRDNGIDERMILDGY